MHILQQLKLNFTQKVLFVLFLSKVFLVYKLFRLILNTESYQTEKIKLTQMWNEGKYLLTPAVHPFFCAARSVRRRIWRAKCTGRDFRGNRNSAQNMTTNGVGLPTPTHTPQLPPSSLPALYRLCAQVKKQEAYQLTSNFETTTQSMEGRWGCGCFFFFCIYTLVKLPGLQVGRKWEVWWWMCLICEMRVCLDWAAGLCKCSVFLF